MRHRILAAFASTLLAVAPAALAQITFTNIVDSTTPTFRGGFASPSINAAGSVGFFATFNPPQGQGLFSGNGTTITTIALTGSIYGGFSPSGTGPSINAAGRLGFHAHLTPSAGGGSGLFLSDGTTTAPIALSSGPYSDFGDPASVTFTRRRDIMSARLLRAGFWRGYRRPSPSIGRVSASDCARPGRLRWRRSVP